MTGAPASDQQLLQRNACFDANIQNKRFVARMAGAGGSSFSTMHLLPRNRMYCTLHTPCCTTDDILYTCNATLEMHCNQKHLVDQDVYQQCKLDAEVI